VVDVPHDGDDGRPRLEIFVAVLELLRLELLFRGVLDRDLALELSGDDLDLLVRERLRRRPHLPERHQDLDELGHRDAERLRKILDGDAGLDGDGAARGCRGSRAWSRRRCAIPWLPTVPAAGAPTFDDDAALAPSRPAARADRSIRSVSPVGHRQQV
jgi:hypothetical protein